MPYTSNPHIGKTRRLAVNDVLHVRRTQSEAARHYGVHRSTIHKWIKRAPDDHRVYITTKSSKPHRHPNQLPESVVQEIINIRKELGRCSPILHAELKQRGIKVSESSIKRILKRNGLTRKKKLLKTPYSKMKRPKVCGLGDLVQMDTIHYQKANGDRFFIYVMIDLYSRVAYAEYSKSISVRDTMRVLQNSKRIFTFPIKVIQTDNGSEFSEAFAFRLRKAGIGLRHSRVRKPNDNAHVERLNRTIQEECFNSRLPKEETIESDLEKYIGYYNTKRLHLGLECMTPNQFVAKVLN